MVASERALWPARAVREWSLYCDWAAATGRAPLPTSPEDFHAFLRDVPANGSTVEHRRRAIWWVNHAKGYTHLQNPSTPGPQRAVREGAGWLSLSDAIAACPTRTWPSGLHGRRDAWLLVLLGHLELTKRKVWALGPRDLDVVSLRVSGKDVPFNDDPARCPRCVVARWSVVLNALGARYADRTFLQEAVRSQRVPRGNHECSTPPRVEWGCLEALTLAFDHRGGTDLDRSISTRAMSAIVSARQTAAVLSASDPAGTFDTDDMSQDDVVAGRYAQLDDDELLAEFERLDAAAAEAIRRAEAAMGADWRDVQARWRAE